MKPSGFLNKTPSINEKQKSGHSKTVKSEPNPRQRNWSELDKVGNSDETLGSDQLAFQFTVNTIL